ncbi:hypothetical protein GOODEAATRI_003348, partial [Goodea atripinnis]
DNNGVIGLLEAMKTSPDPVKIPLTESVVKVASGMRDFVSPSYCFIFSLHNPRGLFVFKTTVYAIIGNDHVVLLTLDGNLYTSGCAEQGQLGRVPEHFSNRGGRKGLERLLVPQMVKLKGKVHFIDAFCGAYFTFAVSEEGYVYGFGLSNYHQLGQVYSLGRAEYGRLGLGQGAEEKSEPAPVTGMEPAKGVSCGASVSYAVTRAGSVYAWGMGTNLQLGTGEEEDEWSPVKMTGKQLENREVLLASSGGQHTVLLVKDKQES